MNPINRKNNICFQYAVTVGLNYEEIGKHTERITKIKPFIDKYNLEGITIHQKKMIGKNLRRIM